jgi:hypothetical protein
VTRRLWFTRAWFVFAISARKAVGGFLPNAPSRDRRRSVAPPPPIAARLHKTQASIGQSRSVAIASDEPLGIAEGTSSQPLSVGSAPACELAGRATAALDLFWFPIGGGGYSPGSGRLYEALAAGLARRPARDLYDSPLQVPRLEEVRHRGGTGPRLKRHAAGRRGRRCCLQSLGWPIFRYEIRPWFKDTSRRCQRGG